MKIITLNMGPLMLSLFYVLLNQGAQAVDCPTVCTADYSPVCGTDAKTYSNPCNLNVENCKSNSSLRVLFDGECECRRNVACTHEHDPQCGTDGKTYPNCCSFAVAKLCSNSSLEKLFEGECECRQNVACTREYRPRCGTDGKTYSNRCRFAVAKLCTPGLELDKLGKCGNTAGTVKPLAAILVAAILTVLTITY